MAKKNENDEIKLPNKLNLKPKPKPGKKKNYYFDNEAVELLLTEYVKGGCTDIELRNKIMENADELIRQIIRTHKLHLIGSGKDGSTFEDLFQLAWQQIESSLYKFNYGHRHTKVFNFWSQVAKTVMLAHIKKDSRDKRNSAGYKDQVGHRYKFNLPKFDRFIEELNQICKYDNEFIKIGESLVLIMKGADEFITDDDQDMISKIADISNIDRTTVIHFIQYLRLRSLEFTDSPLNETLNKVKFKDSDDEDAPQIED